MYIYNTFFAHKLNSLHFSSYLQNFIKCTFKRLEFLSQKWTTQHHFIKSASSNDVSYVCIDFHLDFS